MTVLESRPLIWWVKQAEDASGGVCLHCSSPGTQAQVFVSKDRRNDWGVVESCCLCGWEHTHIWGRFGIPIEYHPRGQPSDAVVSSHAPRPMGRGRYKEARP